MGGKSCGESFVPQDKLREAITNLPYLGEIIHHAHKTRKKDYPI